MVHVRNSCEKIKTWDVVLTTLVVAFALFFMFLPPVVSRAEGGYESWVRDTTNYKLYSKGTGVDSTEETAAAEKADQREGVVNASVFTEILSDGITDAGSAIDNTLRHGNGGIDCSTTGVIMGSILGDGASLFVFDLVKGNIFGITGSYIYTATRAVVIVLIVILAAWGVGKSVWTSDAVAFQNVKQALASGLLALALIYMMPLIIDWCCTARDFISVEMYERLSSGLTTAGSGTSAIAETLDLPETYMNRYREAPTVINAIIYLMVCCLPCVFIWNYLKIGLQETILFGTFPVFALAGVSDKGTRTRWAATMITNLFIPAIDLALLLIPAYIVEYFFFEESYYTTEQTKKTLLSNILRPGEPVNITVSKEVLMERAPILKAIMVMALFVSVIPARNMILRLFGNAFGKDAGAGGFLGGALAMGVSAAKSVGAMFHGKENPGGGSSKGSESSSGGSTGEEAERNLADMQSKLGDIGSAPSEKSNESDSRISEENPSAVQSRRDDIDKQSDVDAADTLNRQAPSEDEIHDDFNRSALERAEGAEGTKDEMEESPVQSDLDAPKAEQSEGIGDSGEGPRGEAPEPQEDIHSESAGGRTEQETSGPESGRTESGGTESGSDTAPPPINDINNTEFADVDANAEGSMSAEALANAALADSIVTGDDIKNAAAIETGDSKTMDPATKELNDMAEAVEARFNEEKNPILGSVWGKGASIDGTDAARENAISSSEALSRLGNLKTIDNLREKQKGFESKSAALQSVLGQAKAEQDGYRHKETVANHNAKVYDNIARARANLRSIDGKISDAQKAYIAATGNPKEAREAMDRITDLQYQRTTAENTYSSAVNAMAEHSGLSVEAVRNLSDQKVNQYVVNAKAEAEDYKVKVSESGVRISGIQRDIQANKTAATIVNNEINRRTDIEKEFAHNSELRGMGKQVYNSSGSYTRQIIRDTRMVQTANWEKLAERDVQGKMTPLERREAQRAIQKREAYANAGRNLAVGAGKAALKVGTMGAAGAAAIAAGGVASMVASIGGEDAMRAAGSTVGSAAGSLVGATGAGIPDAARYGKDAVTLGANIAVDGVRLGASGIDKGVEMYEEFKANEPVRAEQREKRAEQKRKEREAYEKNKTVV